MMKNTINWFEIPVKDFNTAKSFYETLFETTLEPIEMKEMGSVMAFLPANLEEGGVGGSIIAGPGYEPSEQGALIYFNGGEDLTPWINRVEKAGGRVILPKTSLGEYGYMAQFIDPDGNRLAFHSPN